MLVRKAPGDAAALQAAVGQGALLLPWGVKDGLPHSWVGSEQPTSPGILAIPPLAWLG